MTEVRKLINTAAHFPEYWLIQFSKTDVMTLAQREVK